MSTAYERYFSALADYNAGNPIDDRDIDGEFNAMTTAINRKVLCSGSAPTSPINGQTWVDTTNKQLKMYRTNEWVVLGGCHVGTSAPGTPQEGDLWYDTTNNLLKAHDGSNWYSAITTKAAEINGLTEKTALVAADLFVIEDSEASNAKKKVQRSNVVAALGTLVDKTSSYGAQQATTDGFVVVSGLCDESDTISGYTDGNADPTKLVAVAGAGASAGSNHYVSITFPVKKSNYWKVVLGGSVTSLIVSWFPLS